MTKLHHSRLLTAPSPYLIQQPITCIKKRRKGRTAAETMGTCCSVVPTIPTRANGGQSPSARSCPHSQAAHSGTGEQRCPEHCRMNPFWKTGISCQDTKIWKGPQQQQQHSDVHTSPSSPQSTVMPQQLKLC